LRAGLLLWASVLLHWGRLLHVRLLHPDAAAERMRTPMTTQPSTDSVWRHLSADLRQFIRRRISDEHAADDLLQETFLRIHRNLGTLHDADRLAAWVYQVARNVVRDHYRQADKSTVALALGDIDPSHDGDDHPSQLQCGAPWLDEMIGTLPEGYREAVQLAEIEGLTQQAVAHKFGLSLSGAKSRVQRGRAMLHEVLDQCCRFEFDKRGNIIDCEPKPDGQACRNCSE
jgi:RNA polymerase sigma-70 factor (ECF subfamily)